ncbi:tyrosine-type recombinase/integrase [Luteolibacter ambystomatis]|uniref:Tyrosine-type recombinase/integrase n=1 Tax=Luteolibacter ambystomatis TaxID=2824561 RepID=A0A975IXN7_9BACT|nr:tyrosine-type recombinase/integrase [Luteolibacter ambystomatis]QUE49274.1 tyrosine-type recombinase/integrase [Luteolibacter ambystomatis]
MKSFAGLKPKEIKSGRWQVDVPASLSDSGKRERYWFPSRAKARDYIEKLSDGEALAVSPSLSAEVQQALKLLEGTGASLVDAARLFRERFDKDAESEILLRAGNLWTATAEIEEVTRRSYERTIRFFTPFHSRSLAGIDGTELAALLATWSRGTYREHYGNARTFWGWCARKKWCLAETFNHVEQPQRRKIKRAVVLKPEQVEQLLRKAEEVDPEMAGAYAILLYSGLRKGEAARMTWQDVIEDGIRVSDEQAKLDAARFIPWNDPLRAWGEVFRPDDPETGLLPANFENRDDRIRALCGWSISSKLLGGNPNPRGPVFPRNAWRKTNASIMVASGYPVQDLVFVFGHSEGIETLRRRYVGAITKGDAHRILDLRPTRLAA